VINFSGLSKFSSILKHAGMALACLVYAGMASATVPVVQGRWEFVVTSGDPTTQTDAMGPSSFSTYLLQTPGDTVLTNIPLFTTDTLICDNQSNNNVTVVSSSIDGSGNATIDFQVAVYGGTPFHYVFKGVLALGPPKVITGTYQKSGDSCNLGRLGTDATPDGNFKATWFPDLSGTWVGAFDADIPGTGPTAVTASWNLTTNTDKTLSGTITIIGAGLVNGGASCIATSPTTGFQTITLQSNMAEGVSQSSGMGLELFGTDVDGTRFWVNAYATNPDGSQAAVGEDNPPGAAGTFNDGTNNAYTAFYGISGGPCDGFGGGDAPFLLVTKVKKPPKGQDGPHGRDGQHGARGRGNPSPASNDR
jgi:hypothetical protein